MMQQPSAPPQRTVEYKNLIGISTLILGAVALLMGVGFATQHAPEAYFADEWTWIRYLFVHGPVRGTVCRFFGHATVLPNLHLLLNYTLFGGRPEARAITVASVCVLGTTLLGFLTVKDLSIDRVQKAAILACFAAFGVTPALLPKLNWSFGLTDSLVTFGAIVTAFGLISLTKSETQLLKCLSVGAMLAGTAISTFSFGSGLAVCPAFLFGLLIARAPPAHTIFYGQGGFLFIFLAMVGLPACSMGTAAPTFTLAHIRTDRPDDILRVLETAMVTLGFFPIRFLRISNNTQSQALLLSCAAIGAVAAAALTGYLVRALPLKKNTQPIPDVAQLALATVALVSLGAALLVGIARTAKFGPDVGMAPRYAALSMPFWAAMTALLMRRIFVSGFRSTNSRRAPLYAPLLLAVVLVAADLRWGSSVEEAGVLSRYGALSILLDPAPGSKGVQKYMRLEHKMLESEPRLYAERKDVFGTALATIIQAAREGQNPPRQPANATCQGKFVADPPNNAEPLIAVHGWAADTGGQGVDHLEIFNQRNELAGAGMPAAGGEMWAGEFSGMVPLWKLALFKLVPAFARAYSIYPGWVGMVRATPGTNLDVFEADAVLKDGKRCRLTPVASPAAT